MNVAGAFQPEICAAWARCRLLVAREAAKPRREIHKFEVQQASRGRESAGAAPRMFYFATDEHGFSRIIAGGMGSF